MFCFCSDWSNIMLLRIFTLACNALVQSEYTCVQVFNCASLCEWFKCSVISSHLCSGFTIYVWRNEELILWCQTRIIIMEPWWELIVLIETRSPFISCDKTTGHVYLQNVHRQCNTECSWLSHAHIILTFSKSHCRIIWCMRIATVHVIGLYK